MDWFWHVLIVCVVVIPVTVLWLAIIVELIRRRDLSAMARVAWLVAVLVLPLFGSLIYVIVTWRHAEPYQPAAEVSAAETGSGSSTVADLAQLDQLRRTGAITEEEFALGKSRVLADPGGQQGRHASEGVGS
jgi:hypothetical protein